VQAFNSVVNRIVPISYGQKVLWCALWLEVVKNKCNVLYTNDVIFYCLQQLSVQCSSHFENQAFEG